MDHRVTIGEGGRIVIPAAIRKKLGVKEGDRLMLQECDGQVTLISPMQALRTLQNALKGKISVDDFLAFRKQDSGE